MFANLEDIITHRSYFYSGENDITGQGAINFINRVNKHFSDKELKEGKLPDAYKIYYIYNHLEGKTLRWFLNKNFDITTLTWDYFIKEFENYFYKEERITNDKANNQDNYTMRCIKEFLNNRDRDVKQRGRHEYHYKNQYNYNKSHAYQYKEYNYNNLHAYNYEESYNYNKSYAHNETFTQKIDLPMHYKEINRNKTSKRKNKIKATIITNNEETNENTIMKLPTIINENLEVQNLEKNKSLEINTIEIKEKSNHNKKSIYKNINESTNIITHEHMNIINAYEDTNTIAYESPNNFAFKSENTNMKELNYNDHPTDESDHFTADESESEYFTADEFEEDEKEIYDLTNTVLSLNTPTSPTLLKLSESKENYTNHFIKLIPDQLIEPKSLPLCQSFISRFTYNPLVVSPYLIDYRYKRKKKHHCLLEFTNYNLFKSILI